MSARVPFLEGEQPAETSRLCGDRICCVRRCCRGWSTCYVSLFCSACFYIEFWNLHYRAAEAENRDSFGPRKPAGLDGDSCTQDTGGSCYFFGCADWRNAECVEGSCVCRADQFSVNGQCLPHEWAQKPEKPTAQGFGRDHPVKGKGNFTALVLSGGGAKGAFELGVLEGICKNNSLNHLRNWSMIVGTSIGAMNAGALAQFPPEAQCSKALAAAQSFWDSIKAPEDVWVSSDLAEPSSPDPVKNREPCMTSSRIMSMALAFYRRGGLCDPVPGRNAFEFAVQKDRIRSSGMMLRVVATSLKTGQAKWWDENSDTIIQGCEASGAIAPIIYPMEVDHEAFVDGGFVANTPIMKALQDGAQTVLVVNLDPLSTSGLISDLQALQKADTNVGLRIMQSEFNIMQQRYFLEHELQMACWGFPDRKILAYTPTKDPGDFLSFSSVALQRMRDQGVQTVNETEPVDLCELFFKHYSTDKPNKEERAALAGRPPPVVYAARLRGAPVKLHALTSSTSSQSAPSLQQWMDMRFTTCCFLLGLLAGFSLKQSCVRSSLLPYPELDV